jgi:hypothetical protein
MHFGIKALSAGTILAITLTHPALCMCGGAQDLPPPPPITPPPTRSNPGPHPYHAQPQAAEAAKADASPSDNEKPKAAARGDADEEITVRPAAKADDEATAELIAQISGLGSNSLAERKAALTKLQHAGAGALPVLLSMLDPKEKTDEFTRVEILRFLQDFSPLDDKASHVLAWVATHDPYLEARREACHVIRKAEDDGAIKQLVAYANSNDANLRRAVAAAAREIDYNPLIQNLIKAMQNTDDKSMQRTINTSPTPNPDSPASEIMRAIAGKNLGILSSNWEQWYKEKSGQALGSDYHEPRSARALMGQ